MTPRNPTSQSWTSLPAEFATKATQVFAQNFKKESSEGTFAFEGRIYPREILLRASYIMKGRLKYTNFEVSLDHSPDQKAMEKLFLGIDVLGSVFETYFEHLSEEEEVDYPLNWEEYDFDEGTVFLRFSTANIALEAEADKLLGLSSEGLYVEGKENPSTDALERAEIDAELAEEVSRAIQEGRHRPQGHEALEITPDDPNQLH